MWKQIFGELPDWAKQDNPLLRYELVRNQDKSGFSAGRIITRVTVLVILFLGGYIFATNGLQRTLELPYTEDIWLILIFPAFLIQLVLRIAGISLGVGAVTNERQRQTWDNLRATEQGAGIGLRTRWISVFYRLKGLIFILMAIRIILVLAILYELTAFQGGYLDLLTARSIPTVPVEVGMVLLATYLTAFLILPFTATGVDIALGLLLSTMIRNRAFASVAQVLLIAFRIVSSILLMWLTWRFFSIELNSAGIGEFFLLSANAMFADWGLILAQLSKAGELWVRIPYAVFTGILMLMIALIQVIVAEGLLGLAVRSAEYRE